MVVEEVGEVEEVVEGVCQMVARPVALKVEEVVEEVLQMVGAVPPPEFHLLALHVMVLH